LGPWFVRHGSGLMVQGQYYTIRHPAERTSLPVAPEAEA